MSDIVWTNTTVKLGDLKPWTHNPRQSTKKQARKLLESWEKFGQVQTIAVDPEGNVLDGHQRLSALLTVHGKAYRVDARQSNRALTEQEHKELVITLHAGSVGSWDWDSLSGWDAPDLMEWGFDSETLADWKRDVGALGNLLESEKPSESADAKPQVDKASELQEKWQVQPGELFTIGEHRLICGDCTDGATVAKLMGGEKAGAVVTDSPYGINREGIENDDPEGLRGLFDGCLAVMPIENAVIINFQSPRLFPIWLDALRDAGQKFERALWMYDENDQTKPWHYWLMCSQIVIISSVGKPNWLDCKAHHDCYVIGLSREWRAGGDGNEYAHASVKPAGVVQDFISHVDGIIYDPFLGSGTTMVAAQNLGRKCYGCELSEKYVAVILERMATAFPDLEITRHPFAG